jgi:hypothetical protein
MILRIFLQEAFLKFKLLIVNSVEKNTCFSLAFGSLSQTFQYYTTQ